MSLWSIFLELVKKSCRQAWHRVWHISDVLHRAFFLFACAAIVFFGKSMLEDAVPFIVVSILFLVLILGPFKDALSMIRDERLEKLDLEGKKREAEAAMFGMKEDHEMELAKSREDAMRESRKLKDFGLDVLIKSAILILGIRAKLSEEAFKREVEHISGEVASFLKQHFPDRRFPDVEDNDPAARLSNWIERLENFLRESTS